MCAASDLVDVPLATLFRAFLTSLSSCGFDFLALGVEFLILLAGLASMASIPAQDCFVISLQTLCQDKKGRYGPGNLRQV